MTIPKASISDLLGASSHSTGAPSAQIAHPNTPTKSNSIGDFINMLYKYADPVYEKVSGAVQNTANDVKNATIDTGKGWASAIDQIPAALHGAPVHSAYQPSASGQRGLDLIQNVAMTSPTDVMGTTPDIGGMTTQARGAANTVKNVAKDAKTTLEAAPGGMQAGRFDPFAPIGKAAEETAPVVEKPHMITKNRADPQTIARMSLNFDVPRRVAQNQMVKPDVVMNQLIDDGINAKNLDELHGIAHSITGESGAFPKINNHILESIKNPIDYSGAIASKDTNLSSVLEGEKTGFINQINKEVKQAMSPLDYANKPSESGVASINPITHAAYDVPDGHAYASDLFQTSQNLQKISRMYMRKAYTDMGELNHPEMERAAQALMDIKNNIDDAIDANVSPEVYEQFKNDPYVQEQLQRVPQSVAQRWLGGAGRFKDGQAIQAPYVNLSHMIEDTKDTQLSVWTKAAKAMQQQNGSGTIANTIKENIPGPKILKNAVGGLTKIATKPFDKTAEDIFKENMMGKGSVSGFKLPGGKATKAIAALGLAGGAGAGLEAINNTSNAESNSHTDNGNNSHMPNVAQASPIVNDQIETDMSKIDPKSPPLDPRTVTGSDGHSLAMSDGKHQTAMAALDALVKQDPSYITNPIKAGQLAAAQKAINDKYNDSKKLMDSYNNIATLSQKISDAQNLLGKTSPHLIDKVGLLQGAHEVLDPNYQSLVNDLSFIENSDPRLKGSLSNLGTSGSIKTALDTVAKQLLSQHNQLLKSYGAGTEPTPQAPSSTPAGGGTSSQLPAGLPAPVNGSLPAMQNGSYQFTPPNPMFQQ